MISCPLTCGDCRTLIQVFTDAVEKLYNQSGSTTPYLNKGAEMRKSAFVVITIPVLTVLIFAASFAGRLEQLAYADSGVRAGRVGQSGTRDGATGRGGGFSGRGGYVTRGGHSGYRGYGDLRGHHRHGGHFSGGIWFGPGWGLWDPFLSPPYQYYGYRYYAPPTIVVPQQPEEYILPAPQQPETNYWYYCKDRQGYYPYIDRCPTGWMKVVPTPSPPDMDLEQDQDEEDAR